MTAETEHQLRPATIASAARIAALQAEVFPDSWGERFVASLMLLPGTVAFVAEAEGGLQGYVLGRAIGGQAEIISIAVAPNAQRRGLGAALIAKALTAAIASGAKDIHLEVSSHNAAAQGLYVKAGFAVSGRRPRYYSDGSDALVYRRSLAHE